MEAQSVQAASYVVPTYQAPAEAAWYHFLHGNVPGHEIDFIYRPEVPQGPLTRQHFSHLSRLVKYIEPRSHSAYAFAIGNLSRDDTQYEPGRGGLALIFGLRIQGAKDHAGRQDPPFGHAIAAIDRHFDEARLFASAVSFYRKLLPDDESQAEGSGWYHTYVRQAQNPDALMPLLRGYVADFDDLLAPEPSALGFRWTVEGATPPKRVVIVHGEAEPFESIAACAARIAGVLVESDIRWTAISNGREADVPGGVSIRFVPEYEAGPEEAGVPVLRLEEVPLDPKDLAEQLFGAHEMRVSQMPDLRMGWRQLYGNQASGAGESTPPPPAGRLSSVRPPSAQAPVTEERARPWAARDDAAAEEISIEIGDDGSEKKRNSAVAAAPESKRGGDAAAVVGEVGAKAGEGQAKKPRTQFGLLVGIGVVLAIGGAIAAVVIGAQDSAGEGAAGAGSAVPQSVETGGEAVVPVPTGMAMEVPSGAESAIVAPSAAPAASAVKGEEPSAGKGKAQAVPSSKRSNKAPVKGTGMKNGGGKKKPGDSVFGAPLRN